MNRAARVAQILIYFFSPEDTTELGTLKKSVLYFPLDTRCSRLGLLKVLLWLAIAVVGPIITIMLLSGIA